MSLNAYQKACLERAKEYNERQRQKRLDMEWKPKEEPEPKINWLDIVWYTIWPLYVIAHLAIIAAAVMGYMSAEEAAQVLNDSKVIL